MCKCCSGHKPSVRDKYNRLLRRLSLSHASERHSHEDECKTLTVDSLSSGVMGSDGDRTEEETHPG